jgi:hypothetical protein
MQLIHSILKGAKRGDLRFMELDGDKMDVVIFPNKRWPRMGIVLKNEALVLDYNTSMSFRVKSGNLGFSKDAFAAKCRRPLNKTFLESYFLDNQDNPYGIQNIMNLIHRELDVTTATQFPPLCLPKLTGNERKCAIERLVRLSKKADMIFSTHRQDVISAAIRKYDCCQFSHVAIYLGDGQVADIGPAGGQINSLFDSDDDTHFALYTWKAGIPDESRETVVRLARDDMRKGLRFNYRGIFLMFLRKRFKLPVMRDVPSVADLLFANNFELVVYL